MMENRKRVCHRAFRRLAAVLSILCLSASLAVSAFGGRFEDAAAAYQRGDYVAAYRLTKPLAEQGHARAQNLRAILFDEGKGVPQNRTEAIKWYRKAAEQGLRQAQFNLGLLYYEGEGVPRNYAEALKWYRKAADQGSPQAQYNVGDMYFKGQGVIQDYVQASNWYRRSAEQGLPLAQYNLGVLYTKGYGVPQDYVLAHKWYNLAASRFPYSERGSRENAVHNMRIVASRMTRSQIEEAQRLAREWKLKEEGM